MIPFLRQQFNANFTPAKYQRLLDLMAERCGTPVQFRVCETPCFFPKSLLDQMAQYGSELIHQLETPTYHQASTAAIPPEFNVPNETPHPIFIQVDFGLVRDAAGKLQPKLVELQGFPSLYAYQPMLAQSYMEIFGLDDNLRYLMSGLDWRPYTDLLRRAIVGNYDPENVVLMEIDPQHQKTLPDFLLTETLFGIKTVSITAITQSRNQLSYQSHGREVPIRRVYNRAIVDELVRKNLKLGFRFTDDLDVEWAGHPNWYFRMSKFSLPYLQHECVPKSWFLDRIERAPDNLDDYILKPLFSFAGLGVNINPKKEDLDAVPVEKRSQYILQEKLHFEPVIVTPFGDTKAEVRIMYIWVDTLTPVMTIIRMGRGLMMGVDQNRNMEWVGSSGGFY
ncbi:MAG TPA: hypothetical protein VGV15_14535 [Terriglobales bacterium]|nr:hypothetical protein [Terriglobales bacterium]